MKYKIIPLIKPSMKGALVSAGVMATEILLIAYAVHKEIISDEALHYAVTGALILSVIVGSFVSMKESKTGKLLASIVCSAGIMLILLLINMLFFTTGFSGIPFTALIIFGTSIATTILSNAPKKTRKMKNINF